MSGTLICTLIPKNPKTWDFKNPIRDKISNRFGDKLTSEAIPYLEGLRDSAADRDSQDIEQIIDKLREGYEITISVEF